MLTSLKIVFVVTSWTTANRFVSGFARHLADLGHEVTLMSSGREDIPPTVDGTQSLKWKSVVMKREPNLPADFSSLVRLTRELRQLQPDILVYATPKASLLSAIAGTLARVPKRIYQLWGLRLETIKGPLRAVLGMTEKLTSILSTSVLANSPSLKRKYVELGLAPASKVEVLGRGSSHGVDLEYFSVSATMTSLDSATRHFLDSGTGLTIGFVGRMHPDKGIDTLVQAAILSATRSGKALRLVFVGRDEGALPALSSRELPPSLRVHWTGEVSDPRPYLREFDVIALLSAREGFPNVVLEAAAMGVPAIVSNATGAMDSVVHGATGFVLRSNKPSELADLIDGTQIATLKKMGDSAREYVREHFEQKAVWELYASKILS